MLCYISFILKHTHASSSQFLVSLCVYLGVILLNLNTVPPHTEEGQKSKIYNLLFLCDVVLLLIELVSLVPCTFLWSNHTAAKKGETEWAAQCWWIYPRRGRKWWVLCATHRLCFFLNFQSEYAAVLNRLLSKTQKYRFFIFSFDWRIFSIDWIKISIKMLHCQLIMIVLKNYYL